MFFFLFLSLFFFFSSLAPFLFSLPLGGETLNVAPLARVSTPPPRCKRGTDPHAVGFEQTQQRQKRGEKKKKRSSKKKQRRDFLHDKSLIRTPFSKRSSCLVKYKTPSYKLKFQVLTDCTSCAVFPKHWPLQRTSALCGVAYHLSLFFKKRECNYKFIGPGLSQDGWSAGGKNKQGGK